MSFHILNSKEKKEIEIQLQKQFGIQKLPDKIIQIGKERLRLFTGDFTEKELEKLSKITHIEGIGLYIAKQENDGIRLSIEGAQILKSQIKENIFELNDSQLKEWLSGTDLQIKTGKKGIFIIKYQNDFLGSGKISEQKISNFMPKRRRIKPN